MYQNEIASPCKYSLLFRDSSAARNYGQGGVSLELVEDDNAIETRLDKLMLTLHALGGHYKVETKAL